MKPWIAVPATLALVYRAWSRNSLTPFGIVVAALTAVAHAVHPWSVFFALLVVFFLAGTTVTKVKHEVKAKLTHSSSGSPGGEGPRNHIQVLANSIVASILILAHAWTLRQDKNQKYEQCWRKGALPRAGDVLVAGIVANYAAVAADTFSSELGILATSQPRLITAPWLKVAPGTNGGVTATGILAGFLGAFIVAVTATSLLPFCPETEASLFSGASTVGWPTREKLNFLLAITAIGLCGSLLDSLLGALLQASVIDIRTGKVIEGEGGGKVPVHSAGSLLLKQRQKVAEKLGQSSGDAPAGKQLKNRKVVADANKNEAAQVEGHHESRKVATGFDVLSNNGVNLLMAAMMSAIAVVGTAWLWDVSIADVLGDLLV